MPKWNLLVEFNYFVLLLTDVSFAYGAMTALAGPCVRSARPNQLFSWFDSSEPAKKISLVLCQAQTVVGYFRSVNS